MDKSKSHWAYRPHDYNCQITEIRRYIEETKFRAGKWYLKELQMKPA